MARHVAAEPAATREEENGQEPGRGRCGMEKEEELVARKQGRRAAAGLGKVLLGLG
jgi:hypothetical protein